MPLGQSTYSFVMLYCMKGTGQPKERAKRRRLTQRDRQLADKIRWYRRTNEMTQEELAERLGRHFTYVARVERYKSGVSLPVLYKLAGIFRVKVKELFDF